MLIAVDVGTRSTRAGLLRRLYHDALGVPMQFSDVTEPVLPGTAMAASVGAGQHSDLFAALDAMAPE